MRELADEFIAIRRDIHQRPELAFERIRDQRSGRREAAAWGYRVERGLGGTGVVGQLQRGDDPRAIGLRADMDALPIVETTGLAYASRNPA